MVIVILPILICLKTLLLATVYIPMSITEKRKALANENRLRYQYQEENFTLRDKVSYRTISERHP